METEDPLDPAALTARLRHKLADSAQVCEETVDARTGDPLDRTRTPVGERMAQRAERLQARFGLSHLNRWVLAAIALAVAATGLFATFLSWPRTEPTATAAVEPTAPVETSAETIVVSVAGAVNRPGIVELAQGSRVADAIEAAGGLAEGADPGFLNLARVVADGDLVAVGDTGTGSPPDGAATGGLVNVNVADAQTLATLSGIGPVLAERIIAHRDANGSFQTVDELSEVQGIGQHLLERIRDQVTL